MEYTCTHYLFFTGKVNMKKLIMALGVCAAVTAIKAADADKKLGAAVTALAIVDTSIVYRKGSGRQRQRSESLTSPDGSPVSGGLQKSRWRGLAGSRGHMGRGLTRQHTTAGENRSTSGAIVIPGGGRGQKKTTDDKMLEKYCPDGVPLGVSVKTGGRLRQLSESRDSEKGDSSSGEDSDPYVDTDVLDDALLEVDNGRSSSAKSKREALEKERRPSSLITFDDGSESE